MKYIHNSTNSSKVWAGQTVASQAYYFIAPSELKSFQENDTVLTDIGSGDAVISRTDDSSGHLGVSDGIAYLLETQVKVTQEDPDTGGLRLTPKFAPEGWHQQYFETEFETSSMNSIHEKDWENEDLNYSTLKFYKVVNGAEVECTDQNDIDANCIRTDLLWMPPFDYSIKSGWVAQKTTPASNVYVWALGADLDAQYGGPQAVFAQGGINLTYVDGKAKVGLDGVSGTIMHYNHPQLGDGAGTNRIRFVVRHSAGMKHRLQAVMELFVE
jgi:hypothetical protein